MSRDEGCIHHNLTSSSVKRRLFPPSHHQDEDEGNQIQPLLDLLTLNKEAREKWNFDFEREEPLPGRWQWEKITPTPSPQALLKRLNPCDDEAQLISNQRKKLLMDPNVTPTKENGDAEHSEDTPSESKEVDEKVEVDSDDVKRL